MTVKTAAGAPDAPTAIILNPTAGAGRGRRWRTLLEAEAAGWRPRPRLLATAAPGDATALARRCVKEGARLVIAAGGDGTAHEVVQGLLQAAEEGGEAPTFGYVPLGTGCDLGIALGLPREPSGLLERLRHGGDVRIDVGLLEAADGRPLRRWFLNAANVGLGPRVAERVAGSPRLRRWGTPAYLMAATHALVRMTPWRLRWETDGGRTGEGPVINLSVCNGPSFGGGMRPCPEAGLTSGRLHVAVVEPLGVLAALRQIPRLMGGRPLVHPSIHNFSCREIRISSEATHRAEDRATHRAEDPATRRAEDRGSGRAGADVPGGLPVEVDGEISGPLPVRLSVVPRGLAVRLPEDGARSFDGSG